MDADLLADREHIRAVNQPFIAVRCGDFHLIVDALENQVGDNALQRAFLRFYEVDVLRADDNVYRLVCSESFIDAGKFRTEDFNQLVVDHQTVHDVALADEVGNECVFRLVVDLFRGTHLLDITLVHDNDGIGHRQRLFLIVGNIDKSDA